MDFLVLCFIWVGILLPIYIFVDEYDDGLRVIFCCQSCPMNGLRYNVCSR